MVDWQLAPRLSSDGPSTHISIIPEPQGVKFPYPGDVSRSPHQLSITRCLCCMLFRPSQICVHLPKMISHEIPQRSTPIQCHGPSPSTHYAVYPFPSREPTQAPCVTAKAARTQSSAGAPPCTPYNYNAKRLVTSSAALLTAPFKSHLGRTMLVSFEP